MSLEETIAGRRSVREFSGEPLSLSHLSPLLWAAQGITGEKRLRFRAAPSAGATHPLELFAVAGAIAELVPGIYRYEADNHSLRLHREGDARIDLAGAALGQQFIAGAPVNLVISAIYERTSRYYGRRGERYVHMEAGHAGENIHLQAVALGLAAVMVGAFDDKRVSAVMGQAKEVTPLYIIPVGKPR